MVFIEDVDPSFTSTNIETSLKEVLGLAVHLTDYEAETKDDSYRIGKHA